MNATHQQVISLPKSSCRRALIGRALIGEKRIMGVNSKKKQR